MVNGLPFIEGQKIKGDIMEMKGDAKTTHMGQ